MGSAASVSETTVLDSSNMGSSNKQGTTDEEIEEMLKSTLNINNETQDVNLKTPERKPKKRRQVPEEDKAIETIEQLLKDTLNTKKQTQDEHSIAEVQETYPIPIIEPVEVSMAFDTFLHVDGSLYTCFTENGIMMYFNDTKGIVPFPEDWYSQGRFINGNNEVSSKPLSSESKQMIPSLVEDERTGGLYIPGRGMVMTYMFEDRVNICKYFHSDSGTWLVLPLQWEMNIDFIKRRVRQVKEALPGLVDYKEITAALRQCKYDADAVISIFLSIFGDSLLKAPEGMENFRDTNYFRDYIEKEQAIEDLKQQLKMKCNEVENLLLRNKCLQKVNDHMSEMIYPLTQRLAELEIDQEESHAKIKAMYNQRHKTLHGKVIIKKAGSFIEPEILLEVNKITRALNISNKELSSTLKIRFSEMELLMKRLLNPVFKLMEAALSSAQELEDMRSLYKKEALARKMLYNRLQEICGNVRVFCRCKGYSPTTSCIILPSDEELVLMYKGSKKKFAFDKVYSPRTTQEEVFEGIRPIIASCVDGYNICILAYGQTGSGKTYTMMGSEDNPGVSIRSIRELLHLCNERPMITYKLKISMLEIYNEKLYDLFSKIPKSSLEIRNQGKTVVVTDLTEFEIKTEEDIKSITRLGEKNRRVASTKMNISSSRSHLVLILRVDGTDKVSGVKSHGTLTLCDLAGSERISKTEALGQRLVEAAAINTSLTSLSQVVFKAIKGNALHVPFRNSKLTHLLQPGLSGDAKACVFLNISLDVPNYEETITTLQFGSSVRQVALGKATQHVTHNTEVKTDN
ncbi:kinesin-like protein KIFC3 isoform X1 [Acipenser oxyrinchus oxyrinchus]|uniref:Kinesin-like protein n=1 Tax=Acipenser oxyrinchus oxyrinchus TaxID=40147 RepID=A0AAD8DCJ7_ACIOX|nr:kinesin-like protein KIFC3 isoform X1 [Acipenser oxyrinchus oxyrinchus]